MALTGQTILFIGGGRQAVPAIIQAKSLGLCVVVSDLDPTCKGFGIADYSIPASTYDVDETVTKAIEFHQKIKSIDGVLCVATDVPHTVAAVAHALNLPGIPQDIALLAVNKLKMKQRFADLSIPVPWFTQVKSATHLESLRTERKERTFVLKPVDSRGSRGVLRLTEKIDSEWAFATSLAQSPSGTLMLEEYLAGPQISSETLVVDGKVYTPSLSDRNYELLERYAPYFIENGGSLPSHLPSADQREIHRLIEETVSALGVENGIIKGDLVVSEGKAYIIELALRLSGGYFCTHETPLHCGANPVLANIYLCLGEKVPSSLLTPQFSRHIVQRYLFVPEGIIEQVAGVSNAENSNGIEFVDCWVEKGQQVMSPSHSGCSVAMVMASGDTFEEALNNAELGLEKITVSIREPKQ